MQWKQWTKTSTHATTIIQVFVTLSVNIPSVTTTRYNATILTIEPVEGTYTIVVSRIGPAVKMALAHAQQLYNQTMELRWEFLPGSCGAEVVGASAAEAYYTFGFDVFIGPGCSRAVEVVGHLANSWNLPIISPASSSDTFGSSNVFPRLTRLARFMQNQFVDMVLILMNHYGWTHLVVISDDATSFFQISGLTFDSVLSNRKTVSWNRYAINSKTMSPRDYQHFFISAKAMTRIFVLLATPSIVRDMMLIAHALGYTSGDYAFFVIMSPSQQATKDIWKRNDTNDENARQAFESVIFLQLSEDRESNIQWFQEAMINASLVDYNFDYLANNEQPSSSVRQYYESVMMYAQVLNETLTAGGDPRDGLAMTERMWNRTFQGLGGPLVISEVGDRSSDIAIMDLNPNTGNPEVVYIYRSDTRKIERQLLRDIWWPNGKDPPMNVPTCGFVDEKCSSTEKPDKKLIIAMSVVFTVLLIVVPLVLFFQYRRWRRMSEANLFWWKISPGDLTFGSFRLPGSAISVQSGLQVRSNGKDNMSMVASAMDTGIFKGQQVRLRRLAIKKPVITKGVLHDFKLLREVVAPNLARVLGACLETIPPAAVIELCPKGSLQDLLGSVNFALDNEFKISLANDIVQGLDYLHGSPIGHHGHLSSGTCLIDNRFTVKLTDYGLGSLFRQELVDTSDQEYKRECLWKAPEILRGEAPIGGTKEGDVYSFGIILSELVTRSSPYERETDYLTVDEILERIKRVGSSETVFRPLVDVPASLGTFSDVMSSAWCEDPRQRPSAVVIKKQIKTMAIKFGRSANLLDNLLRRMEHYANNLEKLVEEKTAELAEEQKRSEELLHQILPKDIANRLKAGLPVQPEQYDCVTIYFSDIVGFTSLSSSSTPIQIVDLLNDLYSAFDETLVAFDVYKVETIGDAYMVVSGLPKRNGNAHSQQIARMSLALRNVISVFHVKHRPDEKLQLRIGLNSGPVCAGVVGLKMPRYCLFGDTVNTASRMESNGEGMKIHMSETTTKLLQSFGTFDILPRGEVEIKGKGIMTTYWLIGERHPKLNPRPDKSSPVL